MNDVTSFVDIIGSGGAVAEAAPEPREDTGVPGHGAYQCIIIGGGPAGITAGVYLARKRITTLLISPDLGGQVLWSSAIENYPGYETISGWDLATHFREQIEQQPIHLRIGDSVVSLDHGKSGGTVTTGQGASYRYEALIIASGKRSRPLDVPGETTFKGRGVTYCATCDGPLYRGQHVAVVGGGNSAVTSVIDLLALGCTVDLVNTAPGLQADAVLVERAASAPGFRSYTNHDVVRITGDSAVKGITIRDNESGATTDLDVTGVFIEIGLAPNSAFAEGIVTMNSHREIIVNCRCETSAPGIFGAGDVTNVPNKQIVISAGEGAKAALMANEYLQRLR